MQLKLPKKVRLTHHSKHRSIRVRFPTDCELVSTILCSFLYSSAAQSNISLSTHTQLCYNRLKHRFQNFGTKIYNTASPNH